MTLTQWLIGWVSLIAATTAVVMAAVGLRQRLWPDCAGPTAVLASAILGLSLLVGLGQALGAVGLFRTEAVVLSAVALGWGFKPRRHRRPAENAGPDSLDSADGTQTAPAKGPGDLAGQGRLLQLTKPLRSSLSPTDRWGWLARIALVTGLSVLVLTWLSGLVAVFRLGSSDGDSLMYHLPFATRFVQTGSTAEVAHIGPDPWVAFYPANVELIQAFFMLPFKHVALVPLVSLGWLALALVAAWCIGQQRQQGPLALLLTAAMMTLPIMSATHAGTARVDVATTAFMLAAVALLLAEPRNLAACFVAGLAVGLAVGSKFVVLPTLAVLVVLAGLVLWARRERNAVGLLALGSALPVVFWVFRNWMVAGNPLPMLDLKAGPIGFDALDDDRLDALDNSSILHHLTDGATGAREAIRIGLPGAFGSSLVALALVAAGMTGLVLLLRQRPLGLPHAVAVTGLVSCGLYFITPNTAPIRGFEADTMASVIVALNARYLVPGLLILLCALPLGLPAAWRRTSALASAGAAAAVVYLATKRGDWPEWPVNGGDLVGAVTIALVAGAVVGAPWVWSRTGARSERTEVAPWLGPGLAGVVVVLAIVATVSWSLASSERLNRYEVAPDWQADLWYAVHGEAPGQQVALIGDWVRQPYARDDLRNTVEYIGVARGGGLWDLPDTCDELLGELSNGGYDLAVVQRGLLVADYMDNEIDWVSNIAGSEVVLDNEGGVVVRLPERVAPTCTA